MKKPAKHPKHDSPLIVAMATLVSSQPPWSSWKQRSPQQQWLGANGADTTGCGTVNKPLCPSGDGGHGHQARWLAVMFVAPGPPDVLTPDRQTEQQRTHHGASWAPERSRIGAEWVGWRPSPDPLPTPHHPRLQNQGRVVTLIRAILVGADDGSWRAGLGWGQSGGSWLLCTRHVVTHMCPRPAPVWGDPRREPRAASDSGLTPGICGDPTGAPQGRPSLWCWVQSGTGGAAGL